MKIILSALTLENLENLKVYISKDSQSYAVIFIEEILKKSRILNHFRISDEFYQNKIMNTSEKFSFTITG